MLPNGAGGQQKVAMSGKLGGTISGMKVNGFFRDQQDKENTATFEWTMVSDGNSFAVAARSAGTTENWMARRVGSEQATASHSFDGAYSGSIFGVTSGTIQFSVTGDRVSGTINGTYQKDRFNGSWTGTLNRTTGAMQATLKGDLNSYAFTGNLAGRIQDTQASGTWAAKNQYGNPMGSWGAKKSSATGK
jgi:hypothetical protein